MSGLNFTTRVTSRGCKNTFIHKFVKQACKLFIGLTPELSGLPGVHVVNGPSREDDVIEGLLEGSHGEVHGPDGEQWQGVDAHHDDHKHDVEKNLENEVFYTFQFRQNFKSEESFFSQSVPIKLSSPQAEQLSIYFFQENQ